jgi:hypothetical protein
MARQPIKKRKPLQAVAESIEPGGLHRSLGIPQGQKIPTSQLQSKPYDSTKVKKQKALARTFAKYRQGTGDD